MSGAICRQSVKYWITVEEEARHKLCEWWFKADRLEKVSLMISILDYMYLPARRFIDSGTE